MTPDATVVTVALAPNVIPGENTQLVLAAEGQERVWRCDVTTKPNYKGRNAIGGTLTLYGSPVREGDLKPGQRVSLYEFGKGDVWRTPSKLSLRRVKTGLYRLHSNTPFEATLSAAQAQWSRDGTSWLEIPAHGQNRRSWCLTPQQLTAGPLCLRWRPGS